MSKTFYALLAAALTPLASAQTDPNEFFEMRIRPVFANRCLACHAATAAGGLSMTSRNGLLRGGKTGPAVVEGKPEESLLLAAVRHTNDKMKMPLGQPPLAANEVADIEAWIRRGAPWPEKKVAIAKGKAITPEQRAFWAFQPVRKPAAPAVRNTAWPKNEIDRFVLAKLESQGLAPNRQADKLDLLRRTTYALTGLPPKPEEIEAFVNDKSPGAFAKVVDRLLASPQYGERWGRYWLDISRYSDDALDSDVDKPYPHAFRYRDWVVKAFNQDMPYDTFVKAQIAGDLMEGGKNKELAVGLGFYGVGPELTDDRVDVTTRGFLAMTGACAQCHDHKFDPILTKDYYALQGVFSSTKRTELPLAPADVVEAYQKQAKKVKAVEDRIQTFLHEQATQLAQILASESPRYIKGVREVVLRQRPAAEVASANNLDMETLERWTKYLKNPPPENQYVQGWAKDDFDLEKFRKEALDVLVERQKVDEKNIALKGATLAKLEASTVAALPAERFFLWRDLFFNDFYGKEFKQEEDGILYYGPNRGYLTSDGTIERFLEGRWKQYLTDLRAELKTLKAALPPRYPAAHAIVDLPKAINERIRIGGQPDALGDEAPRAFLTVLSDGDPKPFEKGSGRLELAEAIASPKNPLTPRVMVNRMWQHIFGEGLVRSVSNFGRMGETPSHPELLDYMAARFIEEGWSMKKLQRELLLSATFQLAADTTPRNFEADPGNRLWWRANRQRLDVEAMRDTLLAVSGELDTTTGGAPKQLSDLQNHRRTIYGFVSRRKLDGTLALFDFPNPNATGEQRLTTSTPLQQLYFLNSRFLEDRAAALARRADTVGGGDAKAKVERLYRLTVGRAPRADEMAACLEFAKPGNWVELAKVLLSSNEILFVN